MLRRFFIGTVLLLGIALIGISCYVQRAPLIFWQGDEHPRLFFTADDLPALPAKAATTHRPPWLAIQSYVDTLLTTNPPPVAPVAGDLDTYRNSGNQLIPLAFTCVITAEAPYCDLAKRYLLTYARWTQWGENNERGLGHAHMLLGNSLAYDWLYPRLTSAERQLVQESLGRWADQLYEASIRPKDAAWNNWWSHSYIQNHYVINHSVLGVAGLVLLGEDPRAQQWLDHAVAQLERSRYLLEGIQDGSWHEGLSYQAYMLSMALPFWTNLRSGQGIDLLPHTYLRRFIDWRLYNDLPDTQQYLLAYGNFEWSYLDSRTPNLLRFAANEYANGHAEWLVQQMVSESPRESTIWSTPWQVFEFLYYDPALLPHPPTDLPLAHTLPDLEGVVWRSGWGADDLVFGLKTGAYGGRFAFDTFLAAAAPWYRDCAQQGCRFNFGHNHDDANTFYLFGGGQWLAPEKVGYNDSDSAFHNTILIDGRGQFRPSADSLYDAEELRNSDGALLASAASDHFAYVAADATRRYRHIVDVQAVVRHVLFVRPAYFVMLDHLAATAEHDYAWVSHFGQSVAVEGRWVRGQGEADQILGVQIVNPTEFQTTIDEHEQVPYIQIQPANAEKDVRLIHLLYPTDHSHWQARPQVTLLGDTGQIAGIRVQHHPYVEDVLVNYAQPGTILTIGDYEFDGRVAVVRQRADGCWTKLFLYGTTFLRNRTTGETIVSGIDPTVATERNNPVCQ